MRTAKLQTVVYLLGIVCHSISSTGRASIYRCGNFQSYSWLQVEICAGHQAGEMGTVAHVPEHADTATRANTAEHAPHNFLFHESAEFIRCAPHGCLYLHSTFSPVWYMHFIANLSELVHAGGSCMHQLLTDAMCCGGCLVLDQMGASA